MLKTPASAAEDTVEIASPRGVVRLRREREEDQAFRFRLFCDARPDLALLPLATEVRDQLMTMQIRAQTRCYRAQGPAARFDIVEPEGTPIGRIVVDRPGTAIHIVDQALSPPFRNLG